MHIIWATCSLTTDKNELINFVPVVFLTQSAVTMNKTGSKGQNKDLHNEDISSFCNTAHDNVVSFYLNMEPLMGSLCQGGNVNVVGVSSCKADTFLPLKMSRLENESNIDYACNTKQQYFTSHFHYYISCTHYHFIGMNITKNI